MKNTILKIICIVLSISLLGGCTQTVKSSPTPDELTLWVWDETFNGKAAAMAAEQYSKLHPNVDIHVEVREREQILSDIKNMLSANLYQDLPDIIMIEDYDIQEMLTLYQQEFVDLTDKISADDFVSYKTQLCSKNGRIYGIPFDSGTTALFYRLDLLQRAGYTEQDMQNLTWSRFLEIGEDVYQKTGISMITLDPTDLPLLRIIMQSCSTWFCAQDATTITIQNNPAIFQSLSLFEQMLTRNVAVSANGWNEFISAFQNDRVACIISGAWIISSIKTNQQQAGKWRVAPIPVMDNIPGCVPRSNVGGSCWYILKNAQHSELAADFLVSMFYNNPDFLNQLIESINLTPCVSHPETLSAYSQPDAFFGNQQVTKLLTEFSQEVPSVQYGSHTYEIEEILEREFQNALSNGDLTQCLQAAQTKAQALTQP